MGKLSFLGITENTTSQHGEGQLTGLFIECRQASHEHPPRACVVPPLVQEDQKLHHDAVNVHVRLASGEHHQQTQNPVQHLHTVLPVTEFHRDAVI